MMQNHEARTTMTTHHIKTLTSPTPSFVLSVPAATRFSLIANALSPVSLAAYDQQQFVTIQWNRLPAYDSLQSISRNKSRLTIPILPNRAFAPQVPDLHKSISPRGRDTSSVVSRTQACDAFVCVLYLWWNGKIRWIEVCQRVVGRDCGAGIL